MLAATVTVPIYGRLSDAYGRRPFFVAGILFFMAGSVVGGTADSMTQVIIARAIQGLGAGALIPLAMAVIGDLVPPSDRGRWQGLTGAVFGVASLLGPFSGGWIADHADWRWVFFVSLPVGSVALVVVPHTLRSRPIPIAAPRSTTRARRCSPPACRACCSAIVRRGDAAPGTAPALRAVGAACSSCSCGTSAASSSRSCRWSCSRPRMSSALAASRGFAVGVGMFGAIMFVPAVRAGRARRLRHRAPGSSSRR